MPDVILRILSIIGILLLVLLGMALLLLLIVLFWPVTYRVKGEKTSDRLLFTARADWLFGLLRVRYAYPEPGNVVIKLLWKTLMDTGQKKESNASSENQGEGGGSEDRKSEAEKSEAGKAEAGKSEAGNAEAEKTGAGKAEAGKVEAGKSEAGKAETEKNEAGKAETEKNEAGKAETEKTGAGNAEAGKSEAGKLETVDSETGETEGCEEAETSEPPEESGRFSRLFEKIQKIKYTILKIYDKIKEIWANISYYTALLQEENTALLWGHVKLRLGKILKSIRPRHLKANVLFGTGAPDTTGYVFGIYGMLMPFLGKKVCVTPDFNEAVLEGNMDVSGHITLGTLAWNALKLLLDRKLKLFVKKMKAGRKENGR